jgi:hypothetical protein
MRGLDPRILFVDSTRIAGSSPAKVKMGWHDGMRVA